MKKYLALTLVLATTTVGLSTLFANAASASGVRDHRACALLGPNCRDHRGPIIVVPPRPTPVPPIVVIDPPVLQPPVVTQPPEPPHRFAGISCKKGKRIVRFNGFHHVRYNDCSKPLYNYFAEDDNGYAIVVVNMDGDIVRVNHPNY